MARRAWVQRRRRRLPSRLPSRHQGNDPSVITVGSVNVKGTNARDDDTVNRFSARPNPWHL